MRAAEEEQRRGGVPLRDAHATELDRLRAKLVELEERALAAEQQLGAALDALPDLLFVVDESTTLREFRAPDPTLLYAPAGEFLGKRVAEVLPPDVATVVLPAIAEAFEQGRSVGATYSLELPTGRRWFELSLAARGEPGTPGRRAVALVRDISARRRAQASLRASEAKYRALVENIPDVAWTTARDGHTTFISPNVARVLGFTADEICEGGAALWLGRIHPEEAEQVKAAFEALFSAGRPFDIEYRIQHKDGRWIWLHDRSVSAYETNGVWYADGLFADVSEARLAEQERAALGERVQQAEKMEALGRLAGGIAHDFNNLLTGVLGNASLVLETVAHDEALRPKVEAIIASARQAAELARQMLAYSGRGRFVVEPVDLSSLVREVGSLVAASITKRTALRFELAEGLPAIMADAGQIRRVVMNLIINASESLGGQDGEVRISTGKQWIDTSHCAQVPSLDGPRPGWHVFLRVADDGCGMPPDSRRRVFEPFYSTKATGRGLGLPAALGIVRGHGGIIDLDSAPDEGTTVTVLFPATGAAAPPPAVETAPTAQTCRGRVLVVDDELAIREVARQSLELAGFEVVSAADGPAAVAMLESQGDQIDVALLDFTMPKMSGSEAFKALRRLRPTLPIILSSGYDDEEATASFGKGELAGFLHKPWGYAELVAAVQSALAREGS